MFATSGRVFDPRCRSGGNGFGDFLGTAVMGFSLLLVTAIQIARVLKRKADEKPDANQLTPGT